MKSLTTFVKHRKYDLSVAHSKMPDETDLVIHPLWALNWFPKTKSSKLNSLYMVVCIWVRVRARACVFVSFFSLFFFFRNFYFVWKRKKFFNKKLKKKKCGTGLYIQLLLRSRYENATPNFCWVFCAINKREFKISFVSTHICLALRRLLTFCLTLTH